MDAFWWEATPLPDAWLSDILKVLEAPSRVAAALRAAPYYTLAEETCDTSPELSLLHDASRCLEDAGGWDVIEMIGDLENVTSIGTVQGRIRGSVGNDTFRAFILKGLWKMM